MPGPMSFPAVAGMPGPSSLLGVCLVQCPFQEVGIPEEAVGIQGVYQKGYIREMGIPGGGYTGEGGYTKGIYIPPPPDMGPGYGWQGGWHAS